MPPVVRGEHRSNELPALSVNCNTRLREARMLAAAVERILRGGLESRRSLQELEFLRGRGPAQDLIAMRKAAEAFDDGFVIEFKF
jgi:hypothetical protein